MNRLRTLATCLFALAWADAIACSPNAPPVPRPGESDMDYRTRAWSERLASPVYTYIFSARVVATVRDESNPRSQPPSHLLVHIADVRVHRGKAPSDGMLAVDACGGAPQDDGRILVATHDGYTINGANVWTDAREFQALEQAMRQQPPHRVDPP